VHFRERKPHINTNEELKIKNGELKIKGQLVISSVPSFLSIILYFAILNSSLFSFCILHSRVNFVN